MKTNVQLTYLLCWPMWPWGLCRMPAGVGTLGESNERKEEYLEWKICVLPLEIVAERNVRPKKEGLLGRSL